MITPLWQLGAKMYSTMKKGLLLTTLGLSCVFCTAIAQRDYFCLYAKNQTDNKSWKLDEIRKITFSSTDVNVYLWDVEPPYSHSYENVRKFTFDAYPLPDGMEAVSVSFLKYDPARKCMLVTGLLGDGQLQIYDYNGVMIQSIRLSIGETECSIESLSAGIYIVKYTGNEGVQTLKIQVK